MNLPSGFGERLNRFRKYARMTKAWSLARRYLVIGAFDGVLTILGMILGYYFSGEIINPKIIFTSGVAASAALGLSSAWGAWEAESAERSLEICQMEHALLRNLEGSINQEAANFAVTWTSFVHGVSPIPAGILPLIPFFFADPLPSMLMTNELLHMLAIIVYRTYPLANPMSSITISATAIALGVLFVLGVFLGRTARKNIIKAGLRMILAGVVTAAISLLIGAAH